MSVFTCFNAPSYNVLIIKKKEATTGVTQGKSGYVTLLASTTSILASNAKVRISSF